jgi:hypothetical protein
MGYFLRLRFQLFGMFFQCKEMRFGAVSLGVLLALSGHKYDSSIRISRKEPTGLSAKRR